MSIADRRRVVMVCPAVPRPFGDTAARWYHLMIGALRRVGHDVALLVVSDEPAAEVAAAGAQLAADDLPGRLTWHAVPMRSSTWPPLRRLRSAWHPFSEMRYAPGAAEWLRQELARGYDVLHLEQLWSAWIHDGRPRTLLNLHHLEVIDWEEQSPGTWQEQKALWQMRRATRRLLADAPALRCFTPRLDAHVRGVNPAVQSWVVPFALDPMLYPMVAPTPEPVLGVLGSMHWLPSRSAAERLVERIWPLVRARRPDARCLVAGWGARTHLARFIDTPGVEIRENLASPVDFFSQVGVLLYAPGRGSGMKVKVLESFAYGVPVVTTWEGVEGITYADGTDCFVESSDAALAERACQLLDDAAARHRMRAAARDLLETHYAPAPVMARLLHVYDELARAA